MAPFRMPFTTRKGPLANGTEPANDENARPDSNGALSASSKPEGKDSIALGSKSARSEPNEYKMSSVNDSGIYLPPSPTEKKSFWQRTPTSTTSSSNHRSLLSENEPFSISRESFESYRRSFDISGRSPVLRADSYPSRASLDSRAVKLPRSSVNGNTFDKPQSTEEEDGFEEVGLQDEPKPKKKSFMSRFGESASETPLAAGDTGKSHFGLHLPGRKRGQSGQGAELGSIERPGSKGKNDGPVH